MSDPSIPDINVLRHRIDTLTPGIPEGLTRGDIATLVMASQMQGIAIGFQGILEQQLLDHPEAISDAAGEFQKLSDELLEGIAGVNL